MTYVIINILTSTLFHFAFMTNGWNIASNNGNSISFYQEWSKLLRSNARIRFSTDHLFAKEQELFLEQLNDQTYKNYGKTHPFLIKILDLKDAAIDCQQNIIDQFSKDSYSVIDGLHGLLHTTLPRLSSIENSCVGARIQYTPMIAEYKVDERIHRLHVSNTVKDDNALKCNLQNYHTLSLFVTLAPLTSTESSELFSYISGLKTSLGSFNLNVEDHLVTNSKTYFQVKNMNSCQSIVDIAVLLSRRREITWIEILPPIVTHNRWSKGVCDTGIYDNNPLNHNNITGSSEYIGVSDTGIDMTSCYFYDPNYPDTPYTSTNYQHRKVVRYFPYVDRTESSDGHGSHVSGIAAGKAYPAMNYGDFRMYNGIAYSAKLVFFDLSKTGSSGITPPSNINTQMFSLMYNASAKIFTNSWGVTGDNTYSTLAVQVDQFMWDHPDAVVFFSAGNSGSDSSSGSAVQGSIVSPSTNKNGVSVGASLNEFQEWLAYQGEGPESAFTYNSVAGFSSRGPTHDNRLKPDVLAPGWWVTSALGLSNSTSQHCDLQSLSGTSMASPTAAGNAAKIRQYFLQGYYPTGKANPANSFVPSGALLKAMIVHSGQRMSYVVESTTNYYVLSSSYPTTTQGYGRLQLNKVLNFGQSRASPITLFVLGTAFNTSKNYVALTNTARHHSHVFTTTGATSIRVTLSYTDYPGTAEASNAMVNNLLVNVTRVGSSGVFTPYLASGTITSNLQIIDITSPSSSSTYVVNVYVSGRLSTSSQPYALVVTGSLTYLPDTYDYEYNYSLDDKYNLNGDDVAYITALSVIIAFFIGIIYYIRVVTQRKSTILLDPRNFENYDTDMYESDVQDTGMGGRKSILRNIMQLRAQHIATNEPEDHVQLVNNGTRAVHRPTRANHMH